MSLNRTIKSSDDTPALDFTITAGADDAPQNLTGVQSVTLVFQGGIAKSATVNVDPTTGRVSVPITSDIRRVGTNVLEATVVFSGGATRTFPNGRPNCTLTVLKTLAQQATDGDA